MAVHELSALPEFEPMQLIATLSVHRFGHQTCVAVGFGTQILGGVD
jgi:hypothetical protein